MLNSWHWCPERGFAGLALCGMDCIDLTKKTIKNLRIHFSYNKKLETVENVIRHVGKTEKVLKL